ncbi:metallophosphoesterase [Membranihabitans maritimus]|uniref:metallophosphoesterase n=1 Tax=Membranihabitans maritimus TaxID=2904244 RepID=UPI001F25EC3A|nr:metallophosphoesterase [Membranihabitans maritimus]
MIILFIFLVFLDIYAYRSVIQGYPVIGDKIALFWVLNILVYLYFITIYLDTTEYIMHTINIYLRGFVFIYILSKTVLLFPIIIEDITRGLKFLIGKISSNGDEITLTRGKFVKNVSIVLAAFPLVLLGHGMVRNVFRYRIRKEKIRISNLPREFEGFKIVQISDIHAGTFPRKKPILRGIRMINNLNPDLFVFTGDLVNSTASEIDPFIDYFSQIKANYGRYSIYGNHDYGDYHDWKDLDEKLQNDRDFIEKHQRLGWKLLKNESAIINKEGVKLAVIGVENYSTIDRFPRKGDLKVAAEGTEEADFKLLLTHDPTHWEAEVTNKYSDIDLTLSGHTHGFQFGIEIPGVFRWSPSQYIYKQWAGLYKSNNQYLYVNRGFGVLGYPGRVGILPEITLIELIRDEN